MVMFVWPVDPNTVRVSDVSGGRNQSLGVKFLKKQVLWRQRRRTRRAAGSGLHVERALFILMCGKDRK